MPKPRVPKIQRNLSAGKSKRKYKSQDTTRSVGIGTAMRVGSERNMNMPGLKPPERKYKPQDTTSSVGIGTAMRVGSERNMNMPGLKPGKPPAKPVPKDTSAKAQAKQVAITSSKVESKRQALNRSSMQRTTKRPRLN